MIVTEDSWLSLEAILQHSIFKKENDLLSQFDAITGKKGTRILIWNIRRYSIPRVIEPKKQGLCDEAHFN